jgi:outer membrane protein assembly factor BamB
MILALSAALVLLPSSGGADEPTTNAWLQWRGPTRDGRVGGPAWPEKLSDESWQSMWRVALGPSYSGPLVTDKLVITTETKDRKLEVVRAFDRSSGKEEWQTSWEGSLSVPFFAKANGMRDVLVCLDLAGGQIRWKTDFVQELKSAVPSFGFVCSPLLHGDYVYVQAGAGFCKVEKQTGKVVWRTLEDDGGMWGSAFSSPLVTELAGKRQILVQTREKLAGVDPDAGDVLWSQEVPAFRGMNILTPTVHGNTVFTSAYGGKSLLFTIEPKDGILAATEAWTNKATGYMSSPVVIDGHAYLHLRNQRFTCINLATGETRWTTEPYGKYWSLVAQGDKILALDERGELLLIRADPREFALFDKRKISEDETWAHLAVVGNEIFIRELNALAVYRWGPPTATPAP